MLNSPPGPLRLTAEALMRQNSTQGLNTKALQNPLTVPIEIVEVTWTLIGSNTEAHATGAVIACEFMLGELSITNGFIPVWLFGPARNNSEEAYPFTPDSRRAAIYTWPLAHGIRLEPGQVLRPRLRHQGIIQTDILSRVSYSCRPILKDKQGRKPKTNLRRQWFPYVTSFVSKSMDVYSGLDEDRSAETDLLNPYLTDLEIERFTGRLNILDLEFVPTTREFGDPDFGDRFLTLQMTGSDGTQVVKQATPFRNVFSSQTRSWEVPHRLGPGEYYLVDLFKAASPIETPNQRFGQAFVGMVGYRSAS